MPGLLAGHPPRRHGCVAVKAGGLLDARRTQAGYAVTLMVAAVCLAELACPLLPPALFVCPLCGARSQHPDDRRNGYCVRCHDVTGVPDPPPGKLP